MAKGEAAVGKLLADDSPYNFAFIHIKAVDDAGHDRNIDYKIRFLQEIDQMVGSVMERLTAYTQQSDEHKVTLCVTGDHATPVLYGDHSCEPVPFTMLRVDEMPLPPDSVRTFDEMAAAQGGLGRFSGRDVMRILKQFMLMPKQCP